MEVVEDILKVNSVLRVMCASKELLGVFPRDRAEVSELRKIGLDQAPVHVEVAHQARLLEEHAPCKLLSRMHVALDRLHRSVLHEPLAL